MGLVYLAEHLTLHRPVALKLLHPAKNASAEAVRRALREAQALSAVEHDSIVRVLDAGFAESGEGFIALEYLEGLTLKQLVQESVFLPWRWAARAMVLVLEALAAVHRQGFVHRDVKPSNCFAVTAGRPLASEPKIKLIDFGIAKLLDPAPEDLITQDDRAVGTPAYFAPEQARAEPVDARADIYCAGVTLHELLTGRLPSFATADGGRRHDRLTPPSEVRAAAGIPPEMDAIVMRALEPDPEMRFPSAESMRSALEGALSAHPPDDRGADPTRSAMAERREPARTTHATSVRRRAAEGPASTPDVAQLSRLRAKVERFWIAGVLRGFLESATLAPQPRTLEDDLVEGLGEIVQSGPPESLPEELSTAALFEEHDRSLLLVGDPGTGKTTQLLLLARSLLDARDDRIPVVFTLATWTGSAPSLRAWFVDELAVRYQVPAALAESWLAEGRIVPLLDGLDEAPAAQRAGCVLAINRAVHEGALPGIAVSCRTREYLELPRRLRLECAVRHHRLTRETVLGVFAGNPVLAGLSRERRDQLLELAESPLALTLLAHVASITLQPNGLGGSAESQLPQLLDAYVQRTLSRSGKRRLPVEEERFLNAVEHLASALRHSRSAVFRFDTLQAGWLDRPASIHVYALASRIVAAALFGGSLVLAFGLTPLHNGGFRSSVTFGLRTAAATALVAGGVTGLSTARRMARSPREKPSRLRHWLHVGALAGGAAAVEGLALGLSERHVNAGILGFEAGLVAAVLCCQHAAMGDRFADIRPQEALRFSRQRAKGLAPVAALLGALAFVGAIRERDLQAAAITAAYVVVMTLFLGGLRGREVGEDATSSGAIRRSSRTAAVLATLGGGATALLAGYLFGPVYGLCAGLAPAAALWLWYGGLTVIQHAILRGLLRWEGHDYCNERILDAAVDRALLNRAGGGCMFPHPLFLAHLADRFDGRRAGAG